GVGGIATVAEQLLKGLVALDELVLLESKQKVEKRLGRNLELANRLAQGDGHRVPWPAFIAAEQLGPPPAEQFEGAFTAAGLVGEIVGPAAVGVNVMKVPQQPPRQQDRRDREVFVMGPRQPATVRLGFGARERNATTP